ncbi:PD-(D/E)XK nuclease family protein [Streptomyces sp. NPDC058220]|uniref:PD-(D/E)XK nuclease family protein n=1 Tax=Streptomyces sp. NPDC058220 TaxID=3346387 RepID=UPI0036E7FC6B
MTDSWLPPDGVRRTSDVIKVAVGMFKGIEYRCPAADALKARGYRPTHRPARRHELLEHFTFGPFMAACDARAPRPSADEPGDGWARLPKRAHDGLQRWTEHASASYEEAFPVDPGNPLTEVPEPWTYRHRSVGADPRGAREYRFTVWGRCLRSADGTVRELRLPVNRLHQASPPEGFVAAAALVLSEGVPGPPPKHVRIVEVALLDGQVRTLFDGTRGEAVSRYREHGPAALNALLDSQEFRPGSSCAECSYVSVCPALRRAPGLLGVEAQGRPRRTWSVTNGRNYRICPARDHLRRLHLPTADAIERGSAAERGRAVHAYLAARHGRSVLRPCTADVPDEWVPEGFDLDPGQRALGARLLRRHAAVCPLRCVHDGTDVRNEPRVVRHDTAADVVVIAAPDVLYRDADSWVWRETKTSAGDRPGSGPLLERFPQLALGVVLLARGDLGGQPGRSRVELEVLRPGGADLEIIDPFAPAARSAAENVLRDLVGGWHRDDHFVATPGAACTHCEVARWCPSALPVEEGA